MWLAASPDRLRCRRRLGRARDLSKPTGATSGDDGGDGTPPGGASNPPPRSLSPWSGEMEASQGHAAGVDGIGGCLGVRAARRLGAGLAVVITTTFTVITV